MNIRDCLYRFVKRCFRCIKCRWRKKETIINRLREPNDYFNSSPYATYLFGHAIKLPVSQNAHPPHVTLFGCQILAKLAKLAKESFSLSDLFGLNSMDVKQNRSFSLSIQTVLLSYLLTCGVLLRCFYLFG